MARIPVERKRGIPGWAWLLLALLLGALLWLLVALFNDDDRAEVGSAPTAVPTPLAAGVPAATATPTPGANQTPTAAGPPAAAGGPITDMMAILNAPNEPSLVGRQVQLAGVRVQSVPGDVTFWVGPNDSQQLFVVLGKEEQSAGQVEGQVDVNPGQTVTITGVIKQLPGLQEAQQRWGLSAANSAALQHHQLYVQAEQVRVTSQ